MKITIDAKEFKKALSLAKRIVPTSTPKPILSCIKLVAENGQVVMMATDLEIHSRQVLSSAIIEEEGTAIIPIKQLLSIVRRMDKDEPCTLETDENDTTIRGFSFSTKLVGYDPSEYPIHPVLGEGGSLSISTSELSRMINQTLFAAAKYPSHYAMSGVLWEAKGKKTRLVATDGNRLAISEGPLSETARDWTKDWPKGVFVPSKLADIVVKEFKSRKTTNKAKRGFGFGGSGDMISVRAVCGEKDNDNDWGRISLSLGNVTISSSLCIGNFPKYRDVVPKDCVTEWTVGRAEMSHCLENILPIVTDEEYRRVRLDFQENELVVSGKSIMDGESKSSCPIQHVGNPTTICFNCGLLLEVFSKSKSDTVVIGLNKTGKTGKFMFDDGLVYVLASVVDK